MLNTPQPLHLFIVEKLTIMILKATLLKLLKISISLSKDFYKKDLQKHEC